MEWLAIGYGIIVVFEREDRQHRAEHLLLRQRRAWSTSAKIVGYDIVTFRQVRRLVASGDEPRALAFALAM